MAVLSNQARAEVTAELIRKNLNGFGGCTKAQVRAYVDATDDWANNNAAAYNSSLPLPQRTSMSSAEKALGLNMVINRRYVDGS